jgi:hypothetical protein
VISASPTNLDAKIQLAEILEELDERVLALDLVNQGALNLSVSGLNLYPDISRYVKKCSRLAGKRKRKLHSQNSPMRVLERTVLSSRRTFVEGHASSDDHTSLPWRSAKNSSGRDRRTLNSRSANSSFWSIRWSRMIQWLRKSGSMSQASLLMGSGRRGNCFLLTLFVSFVPRNVETLNMCSDHPFAEQDI